MEICEHDLVEETEAKPLIRPTDPATEDQWKVINAAIDTNTIPTKTHEWLVGELDKGKEINVKQASTIIKRIKMQEKEAKSDG
jgi:hypothetical protein